ncbi:MAG: hypothetical protein HZB43_08430 [candidate division Zixibacteria bacterium]|nr:hypothetical protein [candidate division Zixibacteria bacterium]
MINLRTYQVTAPAPPGEIPASQIRFLPGDRRIVTAPAALPAIDDAGPLRVMDVATMTLESTIWPIPSDSLTGEIIGHLAIGPRP